MIIQEISLLDFRMYQKADFQLHPRLTVLIGENGKGKTTILDALSIMLGTFFQGSGIQAGQGVVRKDDNRMVYLRKGDQLFSEDYKAELHAKGSLNKQDLEWKRKVGDRGGEAKSFISVGSELRAKAKGGDDVNLPIFLYYGAGRLWKGHRNIVSDKPSSQLDAYRYCLDPASDQHALERWFMRLSMAELQYGKPSSALESVRQAVLTCISEATKLFFGMEEKQIMLEVNNSPMPFSKLSDGFRNVLAMVADIAHRCSRLNPHLGQNSALESEGVILIDEVDLHLHPKWQRSILADLQKAFPKIQFVVTTHSPFILQSVGDGGVINLNDDNESRDETPYLSHLNSKSIEDLAEELMGIKVPQRSARYQKMYDTAKAYYKLLEREQDADTSSSELEDLKQKLDELSAPFSDNIAYHAFLNMKRIAAGIGSDESGDEP